MNGRRPSGGVLLVRHGAVAERYRSLCYGIADVELGLEGKAQHRHVAERLAKLPIARVVHSGLQRTQHLAEILQLRCDVQASVSPLLRERDFGAWELKSWDAIHRQSGDAMLRMISEPDSYRPGGGETTFELRDRVLQWFQEQPRSGLTVAVTHGGPAAALKGTLDRLPVAEWPRLVPPYAGIVAVDDGSMRLCQALLAIDHQ